MERKKIILNIVGFTNLNLALRKSYLNNFHLFTCLKYEHTELKFFYANIHIDSFEIEINHEILLELAIG